MSDRPKVFGIGFHKTGTSSLAEALRLLGWRVTGPNGVHDPDIARTALDIALAEAETHDAFQDNPWPMLYRAMDRRFPGGRFILTVRPSDDWLRSVVRHFGTASTPMRQWIYGEAAGSPCGNEAVYLARYERHNSEVVEYFEGREDDLLVLGICEGQGWERLCPFLGVPEPTIPFPFVNGSRV